MKDLVSIILPKIFMKDIEILKTEYINREKYGDLYARKKQIMKQIKKCILNGEKWIDCNRIFPYRRFCKSTFTENLDKKYIRLTEDRDEIFVCDKQEESIILYLTKELDLKICLKEQRNLYHTTDTVLVISWEHWSTL